ncbi:hypothetical protein [Paraliomyxa miuraensis]|uniref:hypothetical protein n=1 Tax=Paraliomyxa miuraensis TaxID=376150 RepID=UPI0022514BA4|nr:hypothetical protein [Paraliomyxa miuraensis]MCX4244999.1 hypothetical protein [Paraliomyxa miuraensis]
MLPVVERQPLRRMAGNTIGFSLAVLVDAPVPRVRAMLADLRNHTRLNPLIHEVVELPRDPAEPDAQRCRLYERLKLGPIPLRFWYLATVRAESEHALVAHAWAPMGVHVHVRYTMTPEATRTRLEEHAELTASRLVLGFTVRTAIDAHAAVLERLASILAPPG